MKRGRKQDPTIRASIGEHLARAPVAFAVTEGPMHAVVYANPAFRRLQATGDVRKSPATTDGFSTVNLAPLLDRVFHHAETVRDAIVGAPDTNVGRWSCTIWPVPASGDAEQKLMLEVRDVRPVDHARTQQRAITERLVLSALREQDVARRAVTLGRRARYLSKVSRDLSMSLDESATRDTVRRLTLPRPGTWCIVDIVEADGTIHRLPVEHPDPAKRVLARQLEDQWPARKSDTMAAAGVTGARQPTVVSNTAGAALMLAAHGEENLRILRQIGFGYLLVVPLIVRGRIHGALTFVSREGDEAFTSEEIALATDVAARCALALDNARLYRESDALRYAAEQANQSKSQFLSSMSHELRTPLNAIGGFAELIELGISGPVTKDQQTAIMRIKANQQHLLILITEILNFTHVESGHVEYRYAEVPMAAALAGVTDMLNNIIVERDFVVEGPVADGDAIAWADPDRVKQILVNLVMNAVKYGQGDRRVIALSCVALDDVVVTHVADAGPGIPPDQLGSIFEPFVQLTAGIMDRRGGVGLGLAISRDLARAMGGDLTVESTVGAGARFTLTLPRARASAL